MTHTNNLFRIETKQKAALFRKMITFSILALLFMSFVYMIYWVGVMSDDTIIDYTGHLFTPLASFLFPYDDTLYIYRNTSMVLFSLIFPMMLMYYLIDKTESKLLKENREFIERQEKNKLKLEEKNRLREFDIIKTYSICLSLNYKNSNIKPEAKKCLNNAVFQKLKAALNSLNKNIRISINDVMVIASENFEDYDRVYGVLLKTLAKIQKILNEKHNFNLIPSITTDAYQNNDLMNLSDIQKRHYEIQNFKMENRALTSALFRKKYQHLKHNKFAGIPIGEYISTDKNSNETYELNVVFKDLSKILASL